MIGRNIHISLKNFLRRRAKKTEEALEDAVCLGKKSNILDDLVTMSWHQERARAIHRTQLEEVRKGEDKLLSIERGNVGCVGTKAKDTWNSSKLCLVYVAFI